jgi:hypothetical protein
MKISKWIKENAATKEKFLGCIQESSEISIIITLIFEMYI